MITAITNLQFLDALKLRFTFDSFANVACSVRQSVLHCYETAISRRNHETDMLPETQVASP